MPSFKQKDDQKTKNTKTSVAKHVSTLPLYFSLCKKIWHLSTLQHSENCMQFLRVNVCVLYMYVLCMYWQMGFLLFMQTPHTKHYYKYLNST